MPRSAPLSASSPSEWRHLGREPGPHRQSACAGSSRARPPAPATLPAALQTRRTMSSDASHIAARSVRKPTMFDISDLAFWLAGLCRNAPPSPTILTQPRFACALSHERRDTRVGLHPLEGIFPIDGVVIAVERIVLDVARRPDVDAGLAACRLELDVQRYGKLARFDSRDAHANSRRFGMCRLERLGEHSAKCLHDGAFLRLRERCPGPKPGAPFHQRGRSACGSQRVPASCASALATASPFLSLARAAPASAETASVTASTIRALGTCCR